MIDVSEKFKQYSRDKNRQINVKIEVSNGDEWITFGKENIVEFEIDSGITEGEDFGIGNVIVSKLTLQLYTDINIEKNAAIKPYIQFDGKDGESEWLQLGKFRIDNRKKQGSVWKFDCFDELIKTQQLYRTNLQFPTTSKQLLLEILVDMKFEMDEEFLENMPEFTVTKMIGDYLYTYREVLGYIASIHSSNIIMDNEGKLKFIGATDREVKDTIQPSEYIGLKQINEPKTLTKVVSNVDGEVQQISIGDGDVDNTLFIENPLVTEEIMEDIYNNILDYEFVPMDINKWKCFPYLECGDFIEFEQRDGTKLKTAIQSNKVVFKGGLSGKMSSPAKSFSQSEYGFTGDTNRAISGVEKRMGVYVLSENNTEMTIDTRFQGKMVLPITSLDTTDIEFTITLIGESMFDTILYMEIRWGQGVIGKKIKTYIKEGLNIVSVSFLVRAVPQFSDNLLLFMKVEHGKFVVFQNEGQFYAYGANLVGDSGVPYATVEDTIDYETYIIEGNIVTIMKIPEKNILSDNIVFDEYINSDNVEVLIEEVEE